MIIKTIVDEDFSNYKLPSMVIGFPSCSFKCEKECGLRVCQNSELALSPNIEVDDQKIIDQYLDNKITSAIVFGGLEPIDDYAQLIRFLKLFREASRDRCIIFTGYTKQEIIDMGYFDELKSIGNLIIKYGRFIPDQEKHFDEVLGVQLASPNQFAERIS